MIFSVFASMNLFFLKRIRELARAEHATTDAPWHKIRRRSSNLQSVSTVQTKTLRIREKNPAAWYSDSVRWPVITLNAPLWSIK
jgi:hypothetical protein